MKKLGILCIMAAPVVVMAGSGDWYVTPQVGGIIADNDRPVEDHSVLGGLSIGRRFTDGFALELNGNGTKLDGRHGASDLSLWGTSVDALGFLNGAGNVSPYLTAGAGVLQSDPTPGRNSSDFMMQAGLGVLFRVWENGDKSRSFSLRPEIKARWDDTGAQGHLVDYIGTIGFQFGFGAPAPRPVVALAPPPPPPPAPKAVEITPPPPPPPPARLDSDGDGVYDDQDQCPNTPHGIAVDAVGCPLKGSITLEGVTFEHDSAILTADSRSILSTLATGLKKHPRLRIELQGHTDSTGSDQYNQRLSQQRAGSVRTYLIEQGVAESQLTSKGYGESMPIASNATADGRARNRRVVMSVLDNPGEVKVETTAP